MEGSTKLTKVELKQTLPTLPNITNRITQILIKLLGVSEAEVTLGASFFNDLGADSLDFVELTVALEKEFDIKITDEEAAQLCTLGQSIQYIERSLFSN